MVASGRPVSELAQALGVSASQIHRWIHKSSAVSDPSATSDSSHLPSAPRNTAGELERLKADLRRTEMERDILKKALAIFSRMT
jgi:transposase